ncbi:hypothetical protein D3C84_1017480 [compost metagenome]
MGERSLQEDEIHHLRQSQCDHREVDACAAYGQQAKPQPQHSGSRHRGKDPKLGREAPHLDTVGTHISGCAEKDGMAE